MQEHDDAALGADDDDALGASPGDTLADSTEPAAPEAASEQADPHERKLTSENRGLRKRLRELEAKEAEREQATLTDTERLQVQLAQTTASLEERDTRIRGLALSTQIAAGSAKFGITDTDAAEKLVDQSAIEYDEDSARWVGVDDALRALAQDRPWITQAGTTPSGTNPTNPPRRRTTLTSDDLRRMSTAEINALSEDEINAALTNGR
jgi:hypothetical protein